MKKRNLLIFGCLFLIALPGKAQVTIGSDKKPLDGALLQLKENDNASTASNSSKGLLLPRVLLGSDTDMTVITGLATAPTTYTGLVVYNVNTAASAPSTGTYVWTGAKWHLLENSDSFSLTASNGVLYTGGVVKLGGELSDNTSIDLKSKDLKFNATGNKFFLTGLADEGNSRQLVVNTTTGAIGTSAVIPVINTFVQSQSEYSFSAGNGPAKGGTLSSLGTTLNSGAKIVVPFDLSDVSDNGLTSFDSSTGIFTFTEAGTVELSGYVNYFSNNTITETNGSAQIPVEVLLNLTIQIRKASGGDWEDYSSVRGVFVAAQPWYRNTLQIPSATYRAAVGDQLRLIVVRPYNHNGSTYTFLGGRHGVADGSNSTVSFAVPWGTKFSRGLKLTLIGG